jgi:hypothetical protein
METKKLTTDELQTIKNLNNDRDKLITDFGILEYDIQNLKLQKEQLVEQLQKINILSEKLGTELQNKYGDGNINIDTGDFIPR